MKTGILGGSFNPPHLGHLFIAQSVYREFDLDEVLLLPLGTPPHKTHIASRETREAMCRMLAQAANGLQVCTIELERQGYTYTVDTLRQMRQQYPGHSFYYIIGTDTLFQLEHWRDYRQVFAYTEFICVPRPGDDKEKVRDKIRQLRRESKGNFIEHDHWPRHFFYGNTGGNSPEQKYGRDAAAGNQGVY